jgi:hypothetical protein
MNHSQTIFVAPQFSVSDGDNNLDGATVPVSGRITDRVDVLDYRTDHLNMAQGDSHSVLPPGSSSSEWIYVVLRVVGLVAIASTGQNVAGGAITGAASCYGTTLFPGFFIYSGKKVTVLTVTATAASTVEVLSCVTTTPDDVRLL